MLRFILIFVSLAVAFGLELFFSQFFFIAGFSMPLTAMVLFLCSWKADFGEMVFWAVGAGIFLDSVYPEFFGVYMIVFFTLVFLIGLLRSYLSNTGSFFTKQVAMFSYLFTFMLLVSYLPIAFRFFYLVSSPWMIVPLTKILLAAFLWPLLLAVIWGGLAKLGNIFILLRRIPRGLPRG